MAAAASYLRLKPTYLTLRLLSMHPRVPQSEPPTLIFPSFLQRHRRSSSTLVDAALHSGGVNPEVSETWKGRNRRTEGFRKNLKVVDINGGPDEGLQRLGQTLVVTGSVRNFRVQSGLILIEVNDGSCLSHMVCVLGSDAAGHDQVESGSITSGASIWVEGVIALSQASKQKVELNVKKMVLIPSFRGGVSNSPLDGFPKMNNGCHGWSQVYIFGPSLLAKYSNPSRHLAEFRERKFSSSSQPSIFFYEFSGHQMTLAGLIYSTDPAVLAIKNAVVIDLMEKVITRMQSGVLYGSLDPALIEVVDLKVILPPGFSRGPRQLSYIQQIRQLLLQCYRCAHNESEFKSIEREHFISHILDLNNMLELVCLLFHPYLLSDDGNIMFVLEASVTLQYGGEKFPNLLSQAGSCSWRHAFNTSISRDIDLSESISEIKDAAMKKRLRDVFEFGDTDYKANDYSYALTFYVNVIKHSDRNLGIPLLALRGLLPYIPVDLWSCLTANHIYHIVPILKMQCFTNYWHLSYPMKREIFSSHVLVDPGSRFPLFIDFVAPQTQIQCLRERFQDFGQVMNVDIVRLRDLRTGKICLFKRALVSFSDFEEACIAVEAMNGQVLDGSRISVEHAVDEQLAVYCGNEFEDVSFLATEQDEILFQSFVPGRAALRRMFIRYRIRRSVYFVELKN